MKIRICKHCEIRIPKGQMYCSQTCRAAYAERIKEKYKAYQREYNQRPEIRKRNREYYKRRVEAKKNEAS